MLKLIAGIGRPTEGTVEVRGRVSAPHTTTSLPIRLDSMRRGTSISLLRSSTIECSISQRSRIVS